MTRSVGPAIGKVARFIVFCILISLIITSLCTILIPKPQVEVQPTTPTEVTDSTKDSAIIFNIHDYDVDHSKLRKISN